MLRPRTRVLGPVELVTFDLLRGVSHGISTRHGGVSPSPFESLNLGLSTGDDPANVCTNRSLFAARLQTSLDHVCVGRLSHGNQVSVFRRDAPETWPWLEVLIDSGVGARERIFRTDAVVSDVPGLHFLLTFADCVPLVFWDARRKVVGAAHAGWRGTAKGIGPRVVEIMNTMFGTEPPDIVVGVGPSIGPCCYTVQADTVEEFTRGGVPFTTRGHNAGMTLDLWATNEQQLHAAGVSAAAIENPRLCTSCNVDRFYSHRREHGRTGRFGLCVGVR